MQVGRGNNNIEGVESMNGKALVFSFDAVFALVVVIIAIGAISMNYFASEAESSAYESVSNKAMDRAVVGFYLNQSGSGDISTAKFGRCYTVLRYDPNNFGDGPSDAASWTEEEFCEGYG